MRIFILLAFFGILLFTSCLSSKIKNSSKKQTDISKREAYLLTPSEAKGKRTVYTEIEIDASPQIVQSKFLQFEGWEDWNSVFPKVEIKTGNINNLKTNPTLDLVMDFGREKDPSQGPISPVVYENSEGLFVWGFKRWYLNGIHVFIFEAVENGRKTRFIHYEKMNGMLKAFVMTKKTESNMTLHYEKMNQEFKKSCE